MALHVAGPTAALAGVPAGLQAQGAWAAMSYAERGRVILRARALVLDEMDASLI